ncbi:hypothetical protein [Priestia koreensis]|uniref:hypothetical protein n=1 Tax=Priestia koreensis TaxID=284581 RepID=UPI00345943FB
MTAAMLFRFANDINFAFFFAASVMMLVMAVVMMMRMLVIKKSLCWDTFGFNRIFSIHFNFIIIAAYAFTAMWLLVYKEVLTRMTVFFFVTLIARMALACAATLVFLMMVPHIISTFLSSSI